MCASAILGFPAEISTDSFVSVYVDAAVTYCRERAAENARVVPTNASVPAGSGVSCHGGAGGETGNPKRGNDADSDTIASQWQGDMADIVTDDSGTPCAVPQHINYALRGTCVPLLAELTLYEWACLIIVIAHKSRSKQPASKSSGSAKPGWCCLTLAIALQSR